MSMGKLAEETDKATSCPLDRRQALIGGTALAAGAAILSRKTFAADMAPVATTTAGKIRGYNVGRVKAFRGVPYGAPTGGANRFMPPKPPKPWGGVMETTKLGYRAPQLKGHKGALMAVEEIYPDATPISEDCLRLNIWTNGLRDGGKRAIMVWCHGGGYTSGSGGRHQYDGANLAGKRDVVVVTLNHRLNAFGFLYLAKLGGEKYADSGNVGMLDIVHALKWVRDNAKEFGGDPDNVTIFGQSGGGGKVTTLMAMPPAKGLFHRAIAESGVEIRAGTEDAGTKTAERLMAKLGLKPGQVDELQHLPMQKILDAMKGERLRFGPILDHRSLRVNPFDPAAPAISANVPMITGSTLTEVTFFGGTPINPIDSATLHKMVKQNTHLDDAGTDHLIALYRKDYPHVSDIRLYQIIASDNWMTANIRMVAARKAEQPAPVYVYRFEKTTPVEGGRLGVPHTLEIPYVFDNVGEPKIMVIVGNQKDRFALANKMSTAWSNFAKTGNPNTPGLPHWPTYSDKDREVMVFNDVSRVVKNPHAAELQAIYEIHKREGMPVPA